MDTCKICLLVIVLTVATDALVKVGRFSSIDKHYYVDFLGPASKAVYLWDSYCQREYNGQLVHIDSEEVLFHINAELRLLSTMGRLNDSSEGVSVRGRTTLEEGSPVNATGTHLWGTSDEQCVVLRETPEGDDDDPMFSLYSLGCTNHTSYAICGTDRVPPYKHLYLEAMGRLGCPGNTRVTNASMYMKQDDCGGLGGRVLPRVTVDDIMPCQFEVCGTDSLEDVKGIVLSGVDSCPGDPGYPAYIGPFYGPPCLKLGGKEVSLTEPGQDYQQYFCQLHACRKTKTIIRPTVTFSGVGANCSAEDIAGKVALLVNSTETCLEVHGKPRASENTLYTNKCWLNLCQLTTADCKKSQMGKEYMGRLSVTVSGKTCQRWDSQSPHTHYNTNPSWFPDNSLSDAANYCRNPGDWAEGPFCYTTDTNKVWDICDIPFCEDAGYKVEEFSVGQTRYIYVPSKHTDPNTFCRNAYGASLAMIRGPWEIQALSTWLTHLRLTGDLVTNEVHVGGRAPLGTPMRTAYDNYASVIVDATEGHCLILSAWDEKTSSYNSSTYRQYTEQCQHMFASFICQTSSTRFDHYEVYGGTPQMGIHSEDACIAACEDGCLAVGYDQLEESCWFYTSDSGSPGRAKWSFTYIQKAPSVCHNYLILLDGDVSLNASSLRDDVPSADQARVTSKTLTSEQGVTPGAWIPDVSNTRQWVQAAFSRTWLVYGLIILGMEGVDSAQVNSFKIQTSTNSDCTELKNYVKMDGSTVFQGARNDEESFLITLDRPLLASCVRILPQTWSNFIAMRFDVIGCTEMNIALGASVQPDTGVEGVKSWKVVDGITVPLPSWGSCVLTASQNNPWLSVQLSQFYDVTEVVLYGSKECCDGQLRDVSVKVLNVPPSGTLFTRSHECGYITSPLMGTLRQRVTCSPAITGKYVQVQKQALSAQIAVCEIKVYGHKSLIQNVALNKAAHQVSTMRSASAERAVDGNTDANYNHGSCSATLMQHEKQWWMVDVGDVYTVHRVVIATRSEGTGVTRNLRIYVGESSEDETLLVDSNLCATQTDLVPKGVVLDKECTAPLNGRYVKIVMDYKNYLYLCEVEVLAEPVRVQTYSGNAAGASCHMPFVYKQKSHYSCINEDRQDRFWCATTANYDTDQKWGFCMDVHLWGGRRLSEGVVLVRGVTDFQAWGTVCDDGWDDTDARVVCRQLGYTDGHAVYPPFFSTGPGSVSMANLNCSGTEDSLLACQYQDMPGHCTHYEDAAVRCRQYDSLLTFGYPAAKRQQQDRVKEGIFLLPESQEITTPGAVVAWKFYSKKPQPNTKLALQIWRRVYDLEGQRYLLVGSVEASNALLDDGVVTLANQQVVHVQSGDRIGFSFSNGNPIPYDSTYHCDLHGKVIYRQNASVPVGGIVSMIAKDDAHLGCRLYSVFIQVEAQAVQSLAEFLFQGVYYRVITSPNTKSSADALCENTFGASGHVLRLDTQAEYRFVKTFLENKQLTGEFWLTNKRDDKTQMDGIEWAPCQPEEGKECLMLSNSNKEGTYRWYSSTCVEQHYFICEAEPPETSTKATDVTETSAPSYKSTRKSPTTSTTHTMNKPARQDSRGQSPSRWPVIVGILVPAVLIGIVVIVVVVVIKYKKDTKKHSDYPLIADDTYQVEGMGDDQMSVTSEPAKGSVKLHKNNNDL